MGILCACHGDGRENGQCVFVFALVFVLLCLAFPQKYIKLYYSEQKLLSSSAHLKNLQASNLKNPISINSIKHELISIYTREFTARDFACN